MKEGFTTGMSGCKLVEGDDSRRAISAESLRLPSLEISYVNSDLIWKAVDKV
jgi:hypothetical protein